MKNGKDFQQAYVRLRMSDLLELQLFFICFLEMTAPESTYWNAFKAIQLVLTKQDRDNSSKYIDCLKEIEALLGTYYNPVELSNHTLFVVNIKKGWLEQTTGIYSQVY